MLVAIDARCRGSEHIRQDKPLQDFSGSTSDRRKSYAYALIADGHGGEKYFRSEHGSRMAVLCAVEEMNKVLSKMAVYIVKRDNAIIDRTLKNLCAKILLAWRERVCAHFSEHPLTEDEKRQCEALKIALPIPEEEIPTLYGSTLLSAAYVEKFEFWFALQIGDGKTVAIRETATSYYQQRPQNGGKRAAEIAISDDGSVFYPIPEDEDMGFGVTASLCGARAAEHFFYSFGFGRLGGIAVMSDGLTDSFDKDKLPDFILNIQKNALADKERTKSELEAFLPKLSEQGSGDDVSLAGIFMHEEPANPENGTAVSAEKQDVTP